MIEQRSYLDHAATSPMPAPVLEAYREALTTIGNPASVHAQGQQAGALLEEARYRVAEAIHAESVEVTFTAGGTESINLALKGAYWAQRAADPRKKTILLTAAEHHATIDTALWLEQQQGAVLEWLPVNAEGALEPETLKSSIERVGAENVALATFLAANNEVGTVSDIAALCEVGKHYSVWTHVDAVAALGYMPLAFNEWGASLMSVSAHKIGGPVGVGALAIARNITPEALLHGGSQQRARSGTQNVAGAVAFQAALEYVGNEAWTQHRLRTMRDRLVQGVQERIPEAVFRGAGLTSGRRLPGNAHFTFPGCQGDSLLFGLDTRGISVSVGSACQAGVQEVSHVLMAMGLTEDTAIGSLRMSVGHDTEESEIDALLDAIVPAYQQAFSAGLV